MTLRRVSALRSVSFLRAEWIDRAEAPPQTAADVTRNCRTWRRLSWQRRCRIAHTKRLGLATAGSERCASRGISVRCVRRTGKSIKSRIRRRHRVRRRNKMSDNPALCGAGHTVAVWPPSRSPPTPGSAKTTTSGWRRAADKARNGAGRGHNRPAASRATLTCNRLARQPKRPASTRRPRSNAKRNEHPNAADRNDRRTECNARRRDRIIATATEIFRWRSHGKPGRRSLGLLILPSRFRRH
jgi:hypothetical protein